MSVFFEGFLLGNSAILTNVCLLPLYPGLMAFLAGNSSQVTRKARVAPLGLLVLAGILSMMTLIGLLLFVLQASFASIFPWLLPLIYLTVIGLGGLMLFGINPFNRMTTLQAPILRNPYASAYLYGLLLGPMTLPCTGPIILSAFVLGVGSVGMLADGLGFFLAFGLGFGWPLVILPLFALPLQQKATRWLSQRHALLTRVSGILLIAIGIFGVVTEILPNLA